MEQTFLPVKTLDIRDGKWSSFDMSEFPFVKVKMQGVVESSEDFDIFLHNWRELYKGETPFTLEFDTTEVGMVSMRYAFKMKAFIRELKRNYPRLLEKSIIEVNSSWVKFLLRFIFFMEKPVADVYIFQKGKREDSSSHTKISP